MLDDCHTILVGTYYGHWSEGSGTCTVDVLPFRAVKRLRLCDTPIEIFHPDLERLIEYGWGLVKVQERVVVQERCRAAANARRVR